MLSPVGSTPQYSEIDFSFVSSRRPSASVCWLMASRHSSSSIIFTALTPLQFINILITKRPSSLKKTKNRPLSVIDIGTINNRVTTQIAQLDRQLLLRAVHAAHQARYRSPFPLGITRDTPECNSPAWCVPGSINPRLSRTGTKLLLGSFNACRL